MIDLDWLNASLLAVRCACHALIFLRVASFTASQGQQHRRVVGLVAAMFAGFNLAEALRIMFNFSAFSDSTEVYLPGIMICVLIFVTWSGGNMAAWFPRRVLDKLP